MDAKIVKEHPKSPREAARPEAGDKPKHRKRDTSAPRPLDMVQMQFREVQKAQVLREGKETELSKIGHQIETLESLKEVHGDLSELKKSRQEAEQSLTPLEKETEALQQSLDSLSGLSLRAQKIKLEKTQEALDTPLSVKDVIVKSIESVKESIKSIGSIEIKKIIEFENIYKDSKDVFDKGYKERFTQVTEDLQRYNIEITRYHPSIPINDIHINSSQSFFQKIDEVKYINNEYNALYENRQKKVDQIQEDIRATRLFRDTVLHPNEAFECNYYYEQIKTATASSVFVKDKPLAEHLLVSIEDQSEQLSASLKTLQAKESIDARYPPGTPPEKGPYSQAIRHNKAQLDLHQAALAALETHPTEDKLHDFVAARETAIATLWQPHDDFMKSYRDFLTRYARDPSYKQILAIYAKAVELHKTEKTSQEVLEKLQQEKIEFDRKGFEIDSYRFTENEMQDFNDKLQALADTKMADVLYLKRYSVKLKAIIDYYYAPARHPLQDQIEKNQAEIASTRDEVQHTHSQITEQEQRQKSLERTFQELAGNISSPSLKTIQQIEKQIQYLRQQQRTLQEEVNQRPFQREAPGQTPEQAMVAKHWEKKTKTVSESSTRTEHKSETFQDKKVREYTDLLSSTYQSKYGIEVDRQQAIDSATFLSEQKLGGEKLERSIAVAAHLLHEFGVSLNKVHLNRDTYEIHIAQPGEPNTGKRSNLEPLRINRHGVLLIGNQKLKAGVVATKEGTHTLILSVRAKEISFAADTVMSQSGGVDFEDLLSLKKGGSMDITALAVAREFREEAPGYELVPGTLQSFRSHTTSSDHVRLFRASARETSHTVRVDTHEMLETTGVFPLDVPTFIQKYQLDFCNFSAHEDRLYTMESLWKEASSKNVIGALSSRNKKPQQDFFTSYNVMFTVDSIGETLKTLPKEKLSWRHINPRVM